MAFTAIGSELGRTKNRTTTRIPYSGLVTCCRTSVQMRASFPSATTLGLPSSFIPAVRSPQFRPGPASTTTPLRCLTACKTFARRRRRHVPIPFKCFLPCAGAETDNFFKTDRPIIFVTHSLGGLVCANAIGQQHGEGTSKKSIVDKVRGIIFLGTPFSGARKATLALLVTQFLRLFTSTNEKKLEDLDERSEKLFKIGDDFLKVLWARWRGDAPIEAAFYHEELMTKRHRVSLGFIVDSASAIPRGFTGIGIQANHSGMCKFSGKEVDGFISISGHLRQWIEDLDKIADNNQEKEVAEPISYSNLPINTRLTATS